MSFPLLTVGNTKTRKGERQNYMTFIMHLAPNKLSGYNVCPMASKGCIAGCLNTSGRGIYQKTQNARVMRTQLFFNFRDAFMAQLVADVNGAIRKAHKAGMTPVFRLNGTSDIRWENERVDTSYTYRGVTTIYHANNIMDAFPGVQFYDYTKLANRINLPLNYHLTFSLSESNAEVAQEMLDKGMSVAAVFRNKNLPTSFMGRKVVRGDDTDLRFLDPFGVIIGLSAKGKAKRDVSGFVKDI